MQKKLHISKKSCIFAADFEKCSIMAVAAARQTLTITFDPSSLYAQTLVQTLRLSKLFKVEESPYDMRYVKMVESAEKGESHRISREQVSPKS